MLIVQARNLGGKGSDAVADYEVAVRINERVIERFQVNGHRRTDGWQELLRMIAAHHSPAFVSGEEEG